MYAHGNIIDHIKMYKVQSSSFYLIFTSPQAITFTYSSHFFYKIILLFIDFTYYFSLVKYVYLILLHSPLLYPSIKKCYENTLQDKHLALESRTVTGLSSSLLWECGGNSFVFT